MSAGRKVGIVVLGVLVSGCDILSPTKKGGLGQDQIPTTFKTMDAEGLEHTLFVTPPTGGVDDPKYLGIETVVLNKGAFTRRVITRACVILPEDFSGQSINLVPYEPPDCAGRSADTLDLLPNQSTPTVTGKFRIDGASPGVITLKLKQILSPAFVNEFRFRL
jgi:hypothetical protein